VAANHCPKHHEPHGWQHSAINVHDRRGGSRPGGEKPSGRNEDERWLRLSRSGGSDVAAGVDSSVAYGGGAIFGNPERHLSGPARSVRRQRWKRRKRRRQAHEGMGDLYESAEHRPAKGPRRGAWETRETSWRAAAKANELQPSAANFWERPARVPVKKVERSECCRVETPDKRWKQ